MDTTPIVMLVVLAVVVIILAFRYRDRIKFGLKGPLGTGLDFEGQNPTTYATRTGEGDPGKSAVSAAASTKTVEASGAGSVAVGGRADQARISTRVERDRRSEQ